MTSPLHSAQSVKTVTARQLPVTREMLFARTRELALQAGRTPLQITQGDYERARRELTGESDMDRQEAVLDARPAGRDEVRAATRWENEGGLVAPALTPAHQS